MKNLLFTSLFLFGCATTQPSPLEHHWVQPHFRADCTEKGAAIVVLNKDSVDEMDAESLNKAVGRCGELYKDLPCLRVFIVQSEHQYKVICGASDKADVKPLTPESSPI